MDHLDERLERLKQQMHTVNRRLRWWRGLAGALFAHGLHGIVAMWVVVGWITSAAGQTINCGATLGPGGVFQLQADLRCDEDDIALTVRDRALLDLGGHTVSASGTAVLLEGRGAVLRNGIAVSTGVVIRVEGDGWHTIRGIDTTPGSQSAGIVVVSDHNRLMSNISFSFTVGFQIQGNNNLLANNIGFGQSAVIVAGHENLLINNSSPERLIHGFFILGNKNLLVGNQGGALDAEGFILIGDGNTLVGNIVTRSGIGVLVRGEENRIVGNTALNNGTDLVDAHEDCDENLWQRNVFRTSQAGSSENPACIR